MDPTVFNSGFGPRVHPIFGTVRRHNGLDIKGSFGDPIRSVADGIVVMAEARNGFGNTIVIDHGERLATLYAHQSSFEVGVGDIVRRGQIIGRIGSTGWSTGPHLHLELRRNGVAMDPAGFLVQDEPLSCEVLLESEHALDRTILSGRPECEEIEEGIE
jgi:murein DD-endopeptidase MepM/ murein hydrolase activator NlpD